MKEGPIARAVAALRALVRRKRYERSGGEKARHIPIHWIRKPHIAAGDRLCLFVTVARDGQFLPHALDHLGAWSAAGYRVIVAVPVGALDAPIDLVALATADGIVLRLNRGYDFGAWAAVIDRIGRRTIRRLSILALANDSVLGPSRAFPAMLARADASTADVIGLTESTQMRRHHQSFVLFFKNLALGNQTFTRFWRGVRSGDRDYVIAHYETSLLTKLTARGLDAQTMFADGAFVDNPTLVDWDDLIRAGFPYIKVQLLRDNPYDVPLADWRTVATSGGFDLSRLETQIAALKQHGTAPWAV